MPKRTDIHSILIIGAGPIVIGQGCEFDYSGTQACKALKAEGYRIILINSNPATIMTDPDIADVTYIEPITLDILEKIIATEQPDALLPTLGGQTALNCALALDKAGILTKYSVEMIGVAVDSIRLAEDRYLFQTMVKNLGLEVPKSLHATSMSEALSALNTIGLPLIIRSSFSLGGCGAALIHTKEAFITHCENLFFLSSDQHLMIDEALMGWKEYELEVIRDRADNCIVVCGVENVDPLGIHTGDSITVAPIQTLTDKEYQTMRQAAFTILRAVGVDTGGSNVQFAVNPKTGRMLVIEMNPRVSRSSALVSKASGFPIAKIAAKLAVGYTLNECKNAITGDRLPASFEPSLDYVVVKIPRFNMEKFDSIQQERGPQMYSVGEVMAIGNSFAEALNKAMNSLEIKKEIVSKTFSEMDDKTLIHFVKDKKVEQLWAIMEAFRRDWHLDDIHKITAIDPWFLEGIFILVSAEKRIKHKYLNTIDADELKALKQLGFTDSDLASLIHCQTEEIQALRLQHNIIPTYKRIDSCAGEFPSVTSYFYDSYSDYCEASSSDAKKILIIGSGPNRIGQGIEFDYCCVKAVESLKKEGCETIMVNCNPETVSTDYDIVDRLYCIPLTLESVLGIIELEKPYGVLVQYGGQTPLHLAQGLEKAGVPLLGLNTAIINKTEDRHQFQQLLTTLGIQQPRNIAINNIEEGMDAIKQLGFPVIIRPSFVIGGTAMMMANSSEQLKNNLEKVFSMNFNHSVLLEEFLLDALEIDVDAICDGKHIFIPALLEHVEAAGVHSGDSACVTPPIHVSQALQKLLVTMTKKIAIALQLKGVLNIQYAIKDGEIYVIEVNPRASRSLPFLCKATGLSLIDMATQCLLGKTLAEQGVTDIISSLPYYCVKESVFPFIKFPLSTVILGPEMKSTGEVMGIGKTWQEAYAKAQIAAGNQLPSSGDVYLIADDRFSSYLPVIKASLQQLGFNINNDSLHSCVLIIALYDLLSAHSRVLTAARHAVNQGICYATTLEATTALLNVLQFNRKNHIEVQSIQAYHELLPNKPKHLLTGEELTSDDILTLFKKAKYFKEERKNGASTLFEAKHVALLFDKPSLRTRCSFTVAMRELGGEVIESVGETRKTETPEDHIRVLSGYCYGVVVRTFDDNNLERMAATQTIPVINGLTDLHHPCQILADLFTLQELFGVLNGLLISYIGDGNNILHSLLLIAPKMGIKIHYCCPETRGPNTDVLNRAKKSFPDLIQGFQHPEEAVKESHAVYTDVWTSMGFEKQQAEHLFEAFQVNEHLMSLAKPEAVFMHCLPMERGKEVSMTLPDQPCSVIYQQSENRLHVQKAILEVLL